MSHPGYICNLPHGGEKVRPRAVTYTRKDDRTISARQLFPCTKLTGDYCWVLVNGVTFLNVYKAPRDTSAVQPLINWTPPPNSVAVGDFNSVYCAWQPGVTSPYGQGEMIERWAEDHNPTCLIVGEPTHQAGNTLDLVWTNINGSRAWVDHDECVTSDHLPIRGIIPVQSTTMRPNLGKIRVTKERQPDFARAVTKLVRLPLVLDTIEKV